MEVKAQGKFLRVSPKKVRDIAREVKGKNAVDAATLLRFMPTKGAKVMGKVLKSAMANAENNFNLKKEVLTVSDAFVDFGPKYKRYQPRARGAAYPIYKKTSHITVVVSGEEQMRKIKKQAEEPKAKLEIEKPESIKEKKTEVKTTAEMAGEKEKQSKEEAGLKELARDRKEKDTAEDKEKRKEEGIMTEKKMKEEQKGGFWSRFFRRKTG